MNLVNVITLCLTLLSSEVFSWPPPEDKRQQWEAFASDPDYQRVLAFINELINNNEPLVGWVNLVINHTGSTLLHQVSEQGNAPVAALLLSHGANSNAVTCSLMPATPLSKAISSGGWTVAFLLMRNGAKLRRRDVLGAREDRREIAMWLQCAACYEERSSTSLLCAGLCSMDDPYQGTLMHWAVISDSTKIIVDCLHRNPEHLSAQRADGCTPLHVAVVHGRLRALTLLLSFCCLHSRHCDVLIRNKDNQTLCQLSQSTDSNSYLSSYSIIQNSPMNVAASNGDVETIDFLTHEPLTQDTVNYQRGDGCTPLHNACLAGQGSAVAALLLADADPNITDQDNETPLDWANASDDKLPDKILIIRWLCMWNRGLFTLVLLECSSRLSSLRQ